MQQFFSGRNSPRRVNNEVDCKEYYFFSGGFGWNIGKGGSSTRTIHGKSAVHVPVSTQLLMMWNQPGILHSPELIQSGGQEASYPRFVATG
jgi:hypothetical protein